MDRDLLNSERDRFHTSLLANLKGDATRRALMNRDAALQVWHGERLLSIAAVRSADELKKRVVFRDRHKLALAEHPADRREIETNEPNFAYERLGHPGVLLFGFG